MTIEYVINIDIKKLSGFDDDRQHAILRRVGLLRKNKEI